jgi:uncharacterized protein YndB with AHSA1/START domain
MKNAISVVIVRRFAAPAERVFDAWLDPALARAWLFTTASSAVTRCDIDARVGGSFTIVDKRGDQTITHVGTYLAIDRPRRLVFTFAVPQFSPLFDQVTVEIRALDDGCELTLTNEMAAEQAEWEEPAREGWTMMLNTLATKLQEEERPCMPMKSTCHL